MIKAEYIDHMGDDLRVVNAAKVSFDNQDEELTKDGEGLIGYLARGCRKAEWRDMMVRLAKMENPDEIEELVKYIRRMPVHFTPFTHCMITMRETVPIFVARQRFKHMIGNTYNETSRRYVKDTPSFFMPDDYRLAPAKDIKQGSGGISPDSDMLKGSLEVQHGNAAQLYQVMVDEEAGYNIAAEQARMHLPQTMLTTYWVTGSLYAWANAYIQRSDHHAQQEIQTLAAQWGDILQPLFPVSWKELTG